MSDTDIEQFRHISSSARGLGREDTSAPSGGGGAPVARIEAGERRCLQSRERIRRSAK
jgi:hypothetical protein